MKYQSASVRLPALVAGLLLSAVLMPAQAQLFGGDDEARRAILDLRERVETHRRAAAEADARIEQELKALLAEDMSALRRGTLDLAQQLESLRRELAELRGRNEILAHQLAEVQRQQRNVLAALDERLRTLEPVQVTLDGVQFLARPEETRAFEAGMSMLRSSDFVAAARLFENLLSQFPASGYVPSALYWQGNAHYAARNCKSALQSHQRLLQLAANHSRAAEARLAIATCHLELQDLPSARSALQDLVRLHPQTDAAAAARERLARMP